MLSSSNSSLVARGKAQECSPFDPSGVLTLDQMISLLLQKNARFLVTESMGYVEISVLIGP